ncbi:MAG: TapB family protein, partial [Planctomycetota bacterium]
EYLLKTLAGDAMPIMASYECDARETITVPAGSFDAYRILRNSRPVTDGNFLDKTAVLWYAPEVGYFVRRIEDGVITELESFQRQEAAR